MEPSNLLYVFVILRLLQHSVEMRLAAANRRYCDAPDRVKLARDVLKISEADMAKTEAYSRDRYIFGTTSAWIQMAVTIIFLIAGGLGWVERIASIEGTAVVGRGLIFFALLGVLSGLLSLPFEYFHTFVIEQRHGFNRQTRSGFFIDKVRMLLLSMVLGGLVLFAVLSIIEHSGQYWWLMAWATLSAFSLLTAWVYPTVLAPLFNKFRALDEGELRTKILELAKKVDFSADGISIMDASKRTAHGNAYFTGVFHKKKIVLFDTLVNSMTASEVVAVLAHELGHFKLNHVRWSLLRGFFMSGVMFYLLHICFNFENVYRSFGLNGVSPYGALVVFSLWFGPLGFLMQPFSNAISRRNEFSADSFAVKHIDNHRLLGDALLKLRETSHAMPISHPLYSRVYHSHPPLLERLKALGYIGAA